MRLYWHESESVFAAEFQDFQNDLETVKIAGFRTFGPPEWIWYAPPPGVKALNRLRDLKPASGLTLTEVAFTKYQVLNQKEQEKAALKKQFKDAQKQAKKSEKLPELETYFDEEIGVTCIVVETIPSTFVMPKVTQTSDTVCIVCGQYLYPPLDYPDICLWCDMLQKNELDKLSAL